MEKVVDYDLPVLLDGTVESVLEKVGEMPTNVLEQLLELEKGGKTRSTLLSPVEAELAKRAEEGGKAPGLTGTAAGVTDDKVREAAEAAAQASAGEKTFTQADLDAAVAAAEAKFKASAKATAQPKPKKAKALVIGDKADAPGLVALTGGSSIVLVDIDDVPIPGLEALATLPTGFQPSGEEVLYTQAIDVPTHVVRTELGGAFLLDDGGTPVAKAQLVAPFAIGGGRTTKLPPRTLSFAKPPKVKAAAPEAAE